LKGLAPGFLVVLTSLHAQQLSSADIVSRMTSDLLALREVLVSDEPLQDGVYTREELESLVTVSQSKVMSAYQNELTALQYQRNRAVPRKPDEGRPTFRSFGSPDQAYKLTRALAGKELSVDQLRPLAEGIVAMIESAVDCRDSSSRLEGSVAFHDAAEKTYAALEALRVSKREVRIVTEALFRGAQSAASPPNHLIFK
jgi:hypothetical protein